MFISALHTRANHSIIKTGLSLWFPFDEGAGTTLIDRSGNGKNFTLTNMESGDWGTDVLSFGGTDEKASYTGSAITTTTGSFVARLKIPDIADGGIANIFGFGGASGQTYPGVFSIRIYRTGSVRWFYINERKQSDGATAASYGVSSITTLGDGIYHTYGITCDGTNATKFYIDGSLKTLSTLGAQGDRKRWFGSVDPASQTYSYIAALRYNGADTGFCVMDADDMRFYSTHLTADEHAAIAAGRG